LKFFQPDKIKNYSFDFVAPNRKSGNFPADNNAVAAERQIAFPCLYGKKIAFANNRPLLF